MPGKTVYAPFIGPRLRSGRISNVRLRRRGFKNVYVNRRRSAATLAKRNRKDIKKLKSVGFQYIPFSHALSETVSDAIHPHLLTEPDQWTQIFRGYDVPSTSLPRQYTMKSISINWFAQCENPEVGNLWLQVMVVSVKSKMAAQVLTRTAGLTQLTQNLDYVNQTAGTTGSLQGEMGYKFNPNLYTVHYNSGQPYRSSYHGF